MIAIEKLRYVRLGTGDLPGAVDFAQRVLGLQLVDRTPETAYFRSDHRDHTLVYHQGDPDEQAVGLEVRDPQVLQQALTALRSRGLDVQEGTEEGCALRKVKAYGSFRDASGNLIELVVRPLHSGWRYHGPRDAGITGLEGVALRGEASGADERLWTELFNGRVSDWVGQAAYIRFDDAHHRLAVHPSTKPGVLSIEFGVESVDQIMQNNYHLQANQVRITHGPGRRPTSNQVFLTFQGPDGIHFSYVAEGDRVEDEGRHRPRQFPHQPLSFCAWGSHSDAPEFN